MPYPKIAFIPSWISRVLKRNSLKLEDLLYFERVKPFLSGDDLLGLMAIGTCSQIFTNKDVGYDTLRWQELWVDNTHKDKSALQKSLSEFVSLSGNDNVREDTLTRLFTERDVTRGAEDKTTFEVKLFGDTNVAVIVHSGKERALYANQHKELIQQVVQKLCVLQPYHEVMGRCIGLAYVESLSR
jgi:hypothetical protein